MAVANQKPQPLYATAPRRLCPVCGKPSYSRSGVHPQCAMLAADEVHTSRILARAAALPKPPVLKRYEKRCPKCHTVQHVRRRTCECGHVLN